MIRFSPSLRGLEYTDCIRPTPKKEGYPEYYTNDTNNTKLHQILNCIQFFGSWYCGVFLHYHYSPIHSDLE